MDRHDENQTRSEIIFRGHLPPPFFSAKDDSSRVQYLSEPGFAGGLSEDSSNYGVGGYYGNTYRQEQYRRNRETQLHGEGHPDNYRQLGDRRMQDDPRRAWETEQFSRHGYRTMQDRIERGQRHRGKGPRSYRRSDERILEDLNDQLSDDPWLDASDIETSCNDGVVILSGTVENRSAKRRAEDIAENITGVNDVENRLRIASRY